MKILFQGDSITDAYRDRSNPHDLGPGYPKFAAAYIGDDPQSFAADGIHPTQKGAEFIARQYADYISPLIDSLK